MCETAVPTITPTALDGPVDLSRVHLVGIGGAGMAPLARLCAELGGTVSGSDTRTTKATEALAAAGVQVHAGHATEHLPADATAVVYTHAIGAENPELRAARDRGIPLVHRSAALGQLLSGRTAIGVLGTHGKTSCAGMLASALSRMGLAPSYLVGGDTGGPASGGHLGDGELFIAEIDESDRSFLSMGGGVDVAVITNIEHDHPETYSNVGEVIDAMEQFVRGVRPGGLVVLNADCPASRELADRLRQSEGGLRLVTVGAAADATWRIRGAQSSGGCTTAALTGPDRLRFDLELYVPGVHQVSNAAAAVAAAHGLELDVAMLVRQLRHVTGVSRRFTPVDGAAPAGTRVYDSYAHHATEITADLAAARSLASADGRVLVVFQPAGQARLAAFGPAIGAALAAADQVVLTGSRPGLVPAALDQLAAAVRGAGGTVGAVEIERAGAVAAAVAIARPQDVVVLMGAGDLVDHGTSAAAALTGRAARGAAAV